MQTEQKEKNLELERLVFFSDAVVAIAITLLALDLKVVPTGPHIAFSDVFHAWHKFAAFFLSFLIIAVFWVNHHRFFVYIKDIDAAVMRYNLFWLLFIVLLPFTSSLISEDFFDEPAMLMYGCNVLIVTIFQTLIWHHVTNHSELMKANATESVIEEYRAGGKIAIGNAALAIGITLLHPLLAFVTLITRSFLLRHSVQKYIARLIERRVAIKRQNRE